MKGLLLVSSGVLGLVLLSNQVLAQDELKQAVEGATAQVTKARTVCILLGKAAAAIIGVVGAISVYGKWSNGENDVRKASASWFGGLLFIAIAFMILESM